MVREIAEAREREREMVLWEIAVGTAYFLGLKKTYKLALRIQRRVISPAHPKFRQFVRGRTRNVFDVALKVHKSIQQRDLEAGRSLGNWILRYLNKAKPSAQISNAAVPTVRVPLGGNATTNMIKRIKNLSNQTGAGRFQRFMRTGDRVYAGGVYNSSRHIWRYRFPTLAMMMRPIKPAGINFQYRHLCFPGSQALRYNSTQSGFGGVVREDVRQWMLQD